MYVFINVQYKYLSSISHHSHYKQIMINNFLMFWAVIIFSDEPVPIMFTCP